MELRNRSVALYGRFSAGTRERLQREITQSGGVVARDLTRRSDVFVVGALASALIDSGSLSKRIKLAKERRVPVVGERAFAALLAGETPEATTLPLVTALAPTRLTVADAGILAAFDLISLEDENVRFADAGVIRTAGELSEKRRSLADIVRILARARDLAPTGRHKVVLTSSGDAALKWESGLTTLEGQGFLPLGEHASVEELFEQAELKEAAGERDEAARLYDMCAYADRSDPIAPFNLGNIRLAEGKHDEAAIAYQRALARDADFVEARYNLALALEASGKQWQAAEELARILGLEPRHQDAVFNLAQILMRTGNLAEAKLFYERYLDLDPPPNWAALARKAITYCTSQLAKH
jgi:tetratricopeptide (TPR) repeat protein